MENLELMVANVMRLEQDSTWKFMIRRNDYDVKSLVEEYNELLCEIFGPVKIYMTVEKYLVLTAKYGDVPLDTIADSSLRALGWVPNNARTGMKYIAEKALDIIYKHDRWKNLR